MHMNSSSAQDSGEIKFEADQDGNDNCGWNHQKMPEVFVKCEVQDNLQNTVEPSDIKAETEDIDEELELLEKGRYQSEMLNNQAERKQKYELPEKTPVQIDPSHIKAETKTPNEEFHFIKIDPSDIKAEAEDMGEEVHNSNTVTSNHSEKELLETGHNQSKRVLYQRGELIFEVLPNGNIKCGSCQRSFVNILRHLTNKPECAANIELVEFKTLWVKHKCRRTNSEMDLLDNGHNRSERFVYKRGGVVFEQLPNGNVKCGSCETSCGNILRHLSTNPNCTLNIDFVEFKTLWIKYKCKQSNQKEKKTLKISQQYLRYQTERQKNDFKDRQNHLFIPTQMELLEKSPNQNDPSLIKAVTENADEDFHTIKIDPSDIKEETEDIDEEIHSCDLINCNPSQMEKGNNEAERFVYQRGEFTFEQLQNGRIKCGSCKGSFGKILRHLFVHPDCASNIDFEEFKTLWTKYQNKKNERKRYLKKKISTTEQILRNQAERKREYDNRIQMEEPPNQIDPSRIKVEIEDTDEAFDTSDPLDQSEKFVYQRGEVIFEHVPGGKVKCGSCKGSFDRLIPHLTRNPICALNIDVDEVKALWAKYKNKQHNRRKYEKKKLKNSEKILYDKKYEKFIFNPSQMDELEKSRIQSNRFVFQNGDVIFKQLNNGKVECGCCKDSFEEILLHLTSSPACTLSIDFSKFETLWSRHQDKQCEALYYQRKKLKHTELILKKEDEMQKKFVQKKIAENPDQLLKDEPC